MDVYQCPECELRFKYPDELRDHLAVDHPSFHVDAKTVEDALIKASNRHRHAASYKPGPDVNAG